MQVRTQLWWLAFVGCGPSDNPAAAETDGTDGGTSTTGAATDVATPTDEAADSTGPAPSCEPGLTRCTDEATLEVCADDGLAWVAEVCVETATCIVCETEECTEDSCISACDLAVGTAGCDFVATRMLVPAEDMDDRLTVVNPHRTVTADIELYQVQSDGDELLVEEASLAPGQAVNWAMDTEVGPPQAYFRTGGMYRVRSDLPVAAFHHAPGSLFTANDSSLLLPTRLLGTRYIAAAYNPYAASASGFPSFVEVVVLSDNTTLSWTPPVPTEPLSLAIGPVLAGQTGEVPGLRAYEALRLTPSNAFDDIPLGDRDMSGTVIEASAPVLVASGTRCAHVPRGEEFGQGFCDAVQEVAMPLEHWGRQYVAAAPPLRDDERHYWRIYAGGDGTTTFTTEPPVLTPLNCALPAILDGDACTLPTLGAWTEIEVDHGVDFIVQGVAESDRLMVVGYLQSRALPGDPPGPSTDLGDAAMYQLVPTDAFDVRYVVPPATAFDLEYLQIVRQSGGATVFVGGASATGWRQLGALEVTDVAVSASSVVVEGTEPFGLTRFGYSDSDADQRCPKPADECNAAYAHPMGWTTSARR